MGRKKQFIEKLSIEELTTLEQGYKNSSRSDFRNRCQIILLSHKLMDVFEISRVTDLSTITIYKTLTKWRKHGISGLIRKRGQGRKPRLDINNATHVSLVEQKTAENPQKIEELIPSIVEELGVRSFSKWTLKRFLKSLTTAGNDSEDV
jgi:transposase